MNDQSEPRVVFDDERALHERVTEIMLGEEIDFVAQVVISHWHALGVDALVQRLSQQLSAVPRGIVVIYPHPKDGFVIGERDFGCSALPGVHFLFLAPPSSARQRTLLGSAAQQFGRAWGGYLGLREATRGLGGSRRMVLIASVFQPRLRIVEIFRDPHLSGKYEPWFATIDEGIGSHMSEARLSLHRKLDGLEGGTAPSPVMRVLFGLYNLGLSPLAKRMAAASRAFRNEDSSLFRKDRGRLVLNEGLGDSYRQVIAKRTEAAAGASCTSPLALLVTQPTTEYGQIPEEDALSLIAGVVEVLVARGFAVLLKPHPRERDGKYDRVLAKFDAEHLKLSANRMPVETLFSVLRPDCVVGFTSTALPCAKALFDVPAISISDILLARTNSDYLRTTAADFEALTADLCLRASDFEELGRLLDSVCVADERSPGARGFAEPTSVRDAGGTPTDPGCFEPGSNADGPLRS